MQIPYVGLNFAVYESLKDWLVKTRPLGLAQDSELSVTTKLGCGAVAGTIGQTVAYPLDVIRRRMQMGGWKNAASVVTGESKAPLEYSGMVDAFRKTVRHEGVGALYKGLVPNSVKVSLTHYVFFKSGSLPLLPHVQVNRVLKQPVAFYNSLQLISRYSPGIPIRLISAYPRKLLFSVVLIKRVIWFVSTYIVLCCTYMTLCLSFQVVPSIAIAFVTYEVVKDILGVEMRISD